MQKTLYICDKCHKSYVRERAFMNHQCKQMKREAELKTPIGQAAWNYYQSWMRKKQRHQNSADAFLSSNYYRTFINFVEFSAKVKLPLPDKFIWFMVHKDYPPSMWMNDDVYGQYLSFIDKDIEPMAQVNITIKTFLKYTNEQNIDVEQIFDYITISEILGLLRTRQIFPWLLLFSKKFKELLQQATTEQQMILETLIRPEYWGNRIKELSLDEKQKIKDCITTLNI
jgi:hypothetical protein